MGRLAPDISGLLKLADKKVTNGPSSATITNGTKTFMFKRYSEIFRYRIEKFLNIALAS